MLIVAELVKPWTVDPVIVSANLTYQLWAGRSIGRSSALHAEGSGFKFQPVHMPILPSPERQLIADQLFHRFKSGYRLNVPLKRYWNSRLTCNQESVCSNHTRGLLVCNNLTPMDMI